MSARILGSAAALSLLLGACGQRAAETTTNTNVSDVNMTNAAAVGAEAVPTTDPAVTGSATKAPAMDYATNAALSDLYEIKSSELALARGTSAEVKQFAQMMIAEHKATTAQLTAAVSAGGFTMPAPARLDPRRQALVDALGTKSGADFDRLYLSQQKDSHAEALTLHRTYAASGDNPSLKGFAVATAPKVEKHLSMLQRM